MADKKQNWRGHCRCHEFATSVAAAIAVGYFGGKWLDGKFVIRFLAVNRRFAFWNANSGKMMWRDDDRIPPKNLHRDPQRIRIDIFEGNTIKV